MVGGPHQRPLRTAHARSRSGRRLRAAHQLGTTRRTSTRTPPPPPHGLDHRTPGPHPHRHVHRHGRDRAPARAGRGAGHRPPRPGMAAHPSPEGRRRHRLGGLAGRCPVARRRCVPAGPDIGRAVAGRPPIRTGAALGCPDRCPGPPHGGRNPGRNCHRAGAPGHPGDEPGGQGRMAGGVRHPAGAGQRAGLPGHVLVADGRHPRDDRRQARCAGPEPRPRPTGGLAHRGRTGRLCGPLGRRPGLNRAASPCLPTAVRRSR
jgi:hypothetical protein